MQMTDFFVEQLDREIRGSRKALERIPEGRTDWKPHQKSMPLGNLATLVATMPSWIAMTINQDSLDLQPPGGGGLQPPEWRSPRDLLRILDDSVAQARKALQATSEEHLRTSWQLLVGGKAVMERPRYVVIADTFTHLAHHRAQLTVYLRLLGQPVPAIYGPSADEASFE